MPSQYSATASNYRGEILGALGYTLVMKIVLDKDKERSINPTELPKGLAFCHGVLELVDGGL